MLQTEWKHGFSCQARKPEGRKEDDGKWKGRVGSMFVVLRPLIFALCRQVRFGRLDLNIRINRL